METEDLIRLQMEDTRTSLTEKLETLEQKLVETVQDTTAAVQETVATVKESVQETVATVTDGVQETVATMKDTMHEGVESVKEMVDVKSQVEKHPWLMMGGSICVGYVLGSMLAEKRTAARISDFSRQLSSASHSNGGSASTPSRQRPAGQPEGPSILGTLVDKLKGLALSAALGTVREMVSTEAPPAVGSRIKEIIDDVTRTLGAEPLPSSDWTNCPLTSANGTQAKAENGTSPAAQSV